MTYLIWAGVLGLGLALAFSLHRQGQTRTAVRARYFDVVAPLFDTPLTGLAATGFPRLSGRYRGALFDLQVVPDTLTYRKLPALWLLVTLPQPLAVKATLDVMLRPMGVEPFSHFRDLARQIATPANFPADCAIRSDNPDADLPDADLPDADLVAAHIARLDPEQLKELVISPKGLRIVWLAEEADRTRYLAFRDAEMGKTALPAARLQPLLHALIALRDDLSKDTP